MIDDQKRTDALKLIVAGMDQDKVAETLDITEQEVYEIARHTIRAMLVEFAPEALADAAENTES